MDSVWFVMEWAVSLGSFGDFSEVEALHRFPAPPHHWAVCSVSRHMSVTPAYPLSSVSDRDNSVGTRHSCTAGPQPLEGWSHSDTSVSPGVQFLDWLVYMKGLQVHLPSHPAGHVPTLTLFSIRTFLLGVCIIFSFNWRTLILIFLTCGKILLKDFLDRWMTWWCGVDSRKPTEWPKSLGENFSCDHL